MASPNAVAGPSHVGAPLAPSLPGSSSAAAVLSSGALAAYLAPDPAPLRPHSIIHPAHDLLGRYGIIPVYDEFVRPFNTAPISVEDKGKRKEDASAPSMPPAADGTDDMRSGPKEGLFQHGYKHFIKDLGLGKHNHKKDTFLSDLMLNPEKQAVPIVKLDRTTLIHAFRLKEGGVPGFNASALTGDDEKRKKKKKKRPIDPTQPGSHASTPAPLTANPATPSTSAAPAPIRRPPPPPSQLANGHVPHAQPQQSQPTHRPPPQPQRHPLPANPKTASASARLPGTGPGTGGAGAASVKRKDREDGGVNGHAATNGGGGGIGGGTGGLKPAKKRKMVSPHLQGSCLGLEACMWDWRGGMLLVGALRMVGSQISR
ncbi:hypothetical protein FRC10_007659 [Ceratobasidium sp. 414]|nr:hypothetical protein FRC10_007659 [Ceratobasidium sp. 414]